MDIFDIIETTYKTYVQVRRIIFLTQLFLFVSTVTTIWVAAWLLFGINLFSPVFRLVRWICEKFTRFILPKKMCIEIKGKNALITGGSKGIGKALASELIRRGCSTVIIVARNQEQLENARNELSEKCCPGQRVICYPLDLASSDNIVFDVFIEALQNDVDSIDLLINNVGMVQQGSFMDLPIEAFNRQLQVNYLSAVYMTRAVLSKGKVKHIAFVSSAAGQCAIWGYTAYSPSKFAIRGFAEALHMELLPRGIGVSILYPPNTETEGFAEELRTMPEETRQISDSSGRFKPEEVARTFINDIQNGEFSTTIGLEGWMLGTLTAGSAPEPSGWRAIQQICLAGILRAVMLFYLGGFNRVVNRCYLRRQRNLGNN